MRCYVDTSALVKRYVNEARSAEFDSFCVDSEHDLLLTPLVVTEFTSTIQRRVRTSELTPADARRALGRFDADVLAAGWQLLPFEPAAFSRATELIRSIGVPLATLDALHLASALLCEAQWLATADRQLALAGEKSRLQVQTFF